MLAGAHGVCKGGGRTEKDETAKSTLSHMEEASDARLKDLSVLQEVEGGSLMCIFKQRTESEV